MLAQSDYAKMSAFNSNCKVVRGSDGKIHIVYNDVDNIYYNYSTDGGISFGNWEPIPKHELPGQYYGYDTIPAFCLDEDGVPWIVSAVHFFPNWNDKWLEYYLHKRTTQGWRLSYDEVWQKKFIGSQPSDVLHPPSFVVVGDSGYIVFREPAGYGEVFVSSFPIGLNTDYTVTQLAPYGFYPSIGYDAAGRIVVVVNNDGILQLYYRPFNSSWSTVMGIPDHVWVYGSPALWAGNNELCIVFEGGYTDAGGNKEGLVYMKFVWSNGNYVLQPIELVTVNTDWPNNGIEGYGCLASRQKNRK